MRSRVPVIILMLVFVIGYVVSEKIQNAAQYDDADDLSKALEMLPAFISTPVENRRELIEKEKQANAETDPMVKQKLFYDLIGKSTSKSQQAKWYRQIVACVPDKVESARARVALAGDVPDRQDIDAYLAYIRSIDFGDKPGRANQVWMQGWGMAARAGNAEDRLHYLVEMAQVPIIGPGFVDAYEQMKLLSSIHDTKFAPLASERLDTCRELYREQQRQEGRR